MTPQPYFGDQRDATAGPSSLPPEYLPTCVVEPFEERKAEVLKRLNDDLQRLNDYKKHNQIQFLYPETGPYARSGYEKQLAFFKAGKDHRFRLISGGNGTGKSRTMACEVAYHVTGLYPDWWEGKRYQKISTVWVVAKSSGTFRDSLQKHLFGNPGEWGTGLIPKECILESTSIPNTGGTLGRILIQHKNGQTVSIEVKTFDMHRENLQGANVDLVAFDEEPPGDVYEEIVMRTRGTKTRPPGICMMAFTPLLGLTDVALRYIPNGIFPSNCEHPTEKERWAIQITWDDCPHLTEDDKNAMMAEIPANLRDARTRGIPALGSGRVYPVHEDDFVVNYLKIGSHWPRAYGLDFGWNCTAAVWGAKDPETGVIYLYGEYKHGQQAPYVHAHAIKERGAWIPGICDPRGDKSSERDGSRLVDEYTSLGLDLVPGDNSINSGIARVLNLLESGLLKVTYNLEHFLKEFRVYRYDAKDPNKIARNQDDHLMDAFRYLISKFDYVAISGDEYQEYNDPDRVSKQQNFTGRNDITGY